LEYSIEERRISFLIGYYWRIQFKADCRYSGWGPLEAIRRMVQIVR
jgi:hypothetical protein